MGGDRKVTEKPRGIRNNNPGNIKSTLATTWDGEIGVDSDGFLIFDTAAAGLRALAVLLRTYADRDCVRTIEQLVARYAPGGVNAVDGYASFVAEDVGVNKSEVIDIVHLIPLIMRAMIWFENGQDPYTRPEIRDAVAAAQPGE